LTIRESLQSLSQLNHYQISPVIHADEMELLLEMKGEAEQGREGALTRLPAGRVEELTARYDRLVAEGQGAQPPPGIPEFARKHATCCYGY
jgi:hypothetical protein